MGMDIDNDSLDAYFQGENTGWHTGYESGYESDKSDALVAVFKLIADEQGKDAALVLLNKYASISKDDAKTCRHIGEELSKQTDSK